jgi:hypothetical protein
MVTESTQCGCGRKVSVGCRRKRGRTTARREVAGAEGGRQRRNREREQREDGREFR